MRTSVITPLFNRSDLSAKYIADLCGYLTDEDELILIDNASTDNTEEMIKVLKHHYPKHKVIYQRNSQNLGFGTANNIGARLATSDTLIFLNSDIYIKGDILSIIYGYLQEKSRVCVGAKLVNFPTGWNNIWDKIGLIPYVDGWCMGIRKHIFDMVGGFDEQFFLDYEDIDLSLRLTMSDVALAQLTLPVYHPINGSSFLNLPAERFEYTRKSIEYFGRKWGFTIKEGVNGLS